MFLLALFSQNCYTGIYIRPLYICDQSPLEPGAQPFLQPLNVFRRFVACQDNLFVVIMQLIKRIEKLLLGAFTSCNKLYIPVGILVPFAMIITRLLLSSFFTLAVEIGIFIRIGE